MWVGRRLKQDFERHQLEKSKWTAAGSGKVKVPFTVADRGDLKGMRDEISKCPSTDGEIKEMLDQTNDVLKQFGNPFRVPTPKGQWTSGSPPLSKKCESK